MRQDTLARIMHEPPAATADVAVLSGVLGSCTLRRTEQVRLRSEPLRDGRWRDDLHALAVESRT